MRHYEIVANHCLPYFPGIEDCPRDTMSLWPKHLQKQANDLYHEWKDVKDVAHLTDLQIGQWDRLMRQFLEHMVGHMTTKQMARYILCRTKNDDSVAKILYLSGNTDPDYLRCLTLHGFKELFGTRCHDYPIVPHLYKSFSAPDASRLYGRGMTYSRLLDRELHDDDQDLGILQNIENKYYDLIIYGSYHRGMPFYDKILMYYEPEKIILLCGEDIHRCNHEQFTSKHFVFVREIPKSP